MQSTTMSIILRHPCDLDRATVVSTSMYAMLSAHSFHVLRGEIEAVAGSHMPLTGYGECSVTT